MNVFRSSAGLRPPTGRRRTARSNRAAPSGARTAAVGPARECRRKGDRPAGQGVPRGEDEARPAAADVPYGKAEGNRRRGGARGVRGSNRQAGGNEPRKAGRLPDGRRPARSCGARTRMPTTRPKCGPPRSGAPEERRPDRQRGYNAQVRRLACAPACWNKKNPRHPSGVGPRPGARMTIRAGPKRVPPRIGSAPAPRRSNPDRPDRVARGNAR